MLKLRNNSELRGIVKKKCIWTIFKYMTGYWKAFGIFSGVEDVVLKVYFNTTVV